MAANFQDYDEPGVEEFYSQDLQEIDLEWDPEDEEAIYNDDRWDSEAPAFDPDGFENGDEDDDF